MYISAAMAMVLPVTGMGVLVHDPTFLFDTLVGSSYGSSSSIHARIRDSRLVQGWVLLHHGLGVGISIIYEILKYGSCHGVTESDLMLKKRVYSDLKTASQVDINFRVSELGCLCVELPPLCPWQRLQR